MHPLLLSIGSCSADYVPNILGCAYTVDFLFLFWRAFDISLGNCTGFTFSQPNPIIKDTLLSNRVCRQSRFLSYNGSAPLRQQCATDAVTITPSPRWKHLRCQHGITGGTLTRMLAYIWFADLLADSKPYTALWEGGQWIALHNRVLVSPQDSNPWAHNLFHD